MLKIKNKYLIVLFFVIFAFIMLSVFNKVSAFTVNNLEFPDFDNLLSDEKDVSFIAQKDTDNCYYLVISSSSKPDSLLSTYGYLPYYQKIGNDDCFFMGIYNRYKLVDNSWQFLDTGDSSMGISFYTSLSNVIYCSRDIKDSGGNVVFRGPVPTLGEVLEKNNPVQTFQTMTRGIITYLIVFLVGLVAFWKAWQLLSKELRKG